MNDEPQEPLDQLLDDWAASREADEQHIDRLSTRILAAARDQSASDRGVSVTDGRPPTERPVPASIHAKSRSRARWDGRVLIGGGGVLVLLILAGFVLYHNVTATPSNNQQPSHSIASDDRTATDTNAYPTAASLGTAVLAAKQRLLAETNALFDDQLAWIADGRRELSLQIRDGAVQDDSEFLIVRVVVAQRTSPTAAWATIWQTDVISRSEALVEVTPKRLDGASLALWAYRLSDGEVAVDMDLMLDQQTRTQSTSSTVLQAGRPTLVGCSMENGIEQCVFQTVMPLTASRI